MKSALLPVAALVLVLIAPFFAPGVPASAPGADYFWQTVYTYDLPGNALAAGNHTYQFRFHYTSPREGDLVGKPHPFSLATDSVLYPGYALLRPYGLQALVDRPQGAACDLVDTLSTRQNLRFVVVFVLDEKLTKEEQQAHLETLTAEIKVDNGEWEPMREELSAVNWDLLWDCQPWIKDQGSLAYLPPAAG